MRCLAPQAEHPQSPGEAFSPFHLAGTNPPGNEHVKQFNSVQYSRDLRQQIQRLRHAQPVARKVFRVGRVRRYAETSLCRLSPPVAGC